MAESDSSREHHPEWANTEDWDAHRLTIQHLSISDQNLSLKEVIKVMERQHGFHAT